MFTVFDGYCIVFMIYVDIISFVAILCTKYYVFLFIKSLIYPMPNTWFLLARQQKINNGGF